MTPTPSGRLHSLVAVVTGAGSGFGQAIAHAYANEGAAVVVADIEEPAAQRVATALKAAGHTALAYQVDVSSSAAMKALVEATLACFGRIDVVVNNAGISHPNGSMLDVSEAAFDRLYAVNVKSLYHAAIHCVPVFRRQRGGCFINIGSTAAVRPRPGLTWYSGSKGAVVLITKAMAVELAPDRIRAVAINPALGETPLLPTFLGGDDGPETRARFLGSIPLGRFCRPEDVAHAAVFLADPASGFITGVCLEVDGGRCV